MQNQELQLQQYLRIFWRRKWLILLTTIAAAVGVLGVMSLDVVSGSDERPTMYRATTTIVVSSPSVSNNQLIEQALSGVVSERNMQTHIELMRSRNVLERAVMTMRDSSDEPSSASVALEAAALLTAVTIRPVGGTNMLEIRAEADDPEVAERRANAVVSGYVDYLKATQTQAVTDALEETRASLRAAQQSALNPVEGATEVLIALDRQAGFTIGLLNDGLPLVETAIQDAGVTQADGPITDMLSPGLRESLDALATVDEGLGRVITNAQQGSVTRDNVTSVRSSIRGISDTLAALLEDAGSGEMSQRELGARARAELDSAVFNLEIASLQLQAVLNRDSLSSLAYGELSALRTVVADTRTNISGLAQSVRTAMEEAGGSLANGTGAVERFSTAVRVMDGLVTRIESMQQDTGSITQARLAELRSRTQAAVRTLAQARQSLESLEANISDIDQAVDLAVLAGQIGMAEAGLTDAADRFSGVGSGANARSEELGQLERELERLLLSPVEPGVQVVDAAEATPLASGAIGGGALGGQVQLALAVVVGLLVGLIGSLAVEYGDRSVRNGERLKASTRLRPLGSVPRVRGARKWNPVTMGSTGNQPLDEAFHQVVTEVEQTAEGAKGPLLVMGPQPHTGTSTVAFNLARLFARRQRRTLLIDANIRKPDVTRALGLQEHPGLSAVLEAGANLGESVVEAQGIHVLPAGTAGVSPVELFSSPALADLLQAAKATYDVVIIDSAPVVGFAETLVLAREVGDALLVVDAKGTSLEEAQEAVERLEGVRARVIGGVVNGVSPKGFKSGALRGYSARPTAPAQPTAVTGAKPAAGGGVKRWARVPLGLLEKALPGGH